MITYVLYQQEKRFSQLFLLHFTEKLYILLYTFNCIYFFIEIYIYKKSQNFITEDPTCK